MKNQLMSKIEDSIVVIVYPKDLIIDLETAKKLVKERIEYYNGKNFPTLADIRPIKQVTKDARDYLAKGDAVKGIPAGAILVGSYITVFIANLYIRFSKPPMPTKAFTSKEQALQWLRRFAS